MELEENFLTRQYNLKESARQAFSDRTARSTEQLQWWVNREEEVKLWNEVLIKSKKVYKNFLVFIVGSYGRGKTLSLFKVCEDAKRHKQIFPVYLSFKGEERSKPGFDFIQRIFKNIDFQALTDGRSEEEIQSAVSRIPIKLNEPKSVLQKLYFGGRGVLTPFFMKDELKNVFPDSEAGRMALNFITGEIRPTAQQLKILGVVRKLDKIDVLKEYLAAILCFVRNLGYHSLLLAIDEFECLFTLVPKSEHGIYVALLRSLYDFPSGQAVDSKKISNILFFVAVSEAGWNSLRDMKRRESVVGGPTVPLLERTDLVRSLPAFDKDSTRELIELRLKYNRAHRALMRRALIPFSEDFVDFVYEHTKGEPRAIVTDCGQVLDAGILEKVKLLDRSFAQRVLEERGL